MGSSAFRNLYVVLVPVLQGAGRDGVVGKFQVGLHSDSAKCPYILDFRFENQTRLLCHLLVEASKSNP